MQCSPHNKRTPRAKVPCFERQNILGHKVKGVAVVMPKPRTQGTFAFLAEPGQLHQAQDVGAVERRPVKTPPLRVEDVVGQSAGDGGICISGGVGVGVGTGGRVGDGGVGTGGRVGDDGICIVVGAVRDVGSVAVSGPAAFFGDETLQAQLRQGVCYGR